MKILKIIILDALTYAGNLGTIKDDIDNERCIFVRVIFVIVNLPTNSLLNMTLTIS